MTLTRRRFRRRNCCSTARTCSARDKRITNFGGGNTSAKIREGPAHRREVDVLWVKGSGGDLGTMKLDGFSTLYMDKLKSRHRPL